MQDFDNFIHQLGLQTLENLTYRRLLGAGGQAAVCLYEQPDQKQVAVKLLIGPREASVLRRFRDEAEALSRCYSFGDTIVRARSKVSQVLNLPIYYFIMDVAPGESLSSRLGRKPPPWNWKEALDIVLRIATALSPAHLAGFVHRDLHPGNVFVDDSRCSLEASSGETHPGVWILDFGVLSDTLSDLLASPGETAHTFRPIGSVTYASPEALDEPSSVTQKSDMWSLGVLLYLLLSGRHPFRERTLRQLMEATSHAAYEEPTFEAAQPAEREFVLHLVSKLLQPDPSYRLSIRGLTKIVSDALFFGSISWLSNHPPLRQYYFQHEGDVWFCPNCQKLGAPSGTQCPACGIRNEEWLHWSYGL